MTLRQTFIAESVLLESDICCYEHDVRVSVNLGGLW